MSAVALMFALTKIFAFDAFGHSTAIDSGPLPAHGEIKLKGEDYPSAALRERRGGHVGYRFVVSPEGWPISCSITFSSGSPDLDQRTCALLKGRARFRPAIDPSGKPVFAVYRTTASWWIKNMAEETIRPARADIELSVRRLPTSVPDPALIPVWFYVDEKGAISDCAARMPDVDKIDPELRRAIEVAVTKLGPVACAQVSSQIRPAIATDEKGNAVRSLQSATVRFSASPDSDILR